MDWKMRDGIVLTSVCEQYYLVGCSVSSGKCPYVMGINESGAFIWKQMEQGKSIDEIKAAVLREYKISEETDVGEVITEFAGMLQEKGYIISEPTEVEAGEGSEIEVSEGQESGGF